MGVPEAPPKFASSALNARVEGVRKEPVMHPKVRETLRLFVVFLSSAGFVYSAGRMWQTGEPVWIVFAAANALILLRNVVLDRS